MWKKKKVVQNRNRGKKKWGFVRLWCYYHEKEHDTSQTHVANKEENKYTCKLMKLQLIVLIIIKLEKPLKH